MVQLIGKRRKITQNWQWHWDGPRVTRLVTTWRGEDIRAASTQMEKGLGIARTRYNCTTEKSVRINWKTITNGKDNSVKWLRKKKKKSKQSCQSASVPQLPSWGLDPIHNGDRKNKGNRCVWAHKQHVELLLWYSKGPLEKCNGRPYLRWEQDTLRRAILELIYTFQATLTKYQTHFFPR